MAQVPAKHFDPFITFFEKYVTEKQKEIDKLREMENLYIVAKEALELVQIDNDTKVSNFKDYITVDIDLKNEDHYKDFYGLRDKITKLFVERKMREDREPAFFQEVWYCGWVWAIKGKKLRVILHANSFTHKYCKITSKKVATIQDEWSVTWLDKK